MSYIDAITLFKAAEAKGLSPEWHGPSTSIEWSDGKCYESHRGESILTFIGFKRSSRGHRWCWFSGLLEQDYLAGRECSEFDGVVRFDHLYSRNTGAVVKSWREGRKVLQVLGVEEKF